jgi:hypothetical protein
MAPSSVVMTLAPSDVSLDVGGTTDLHATARDSQGASVSLPNGTQVRVDDPLVATAQLLGPAVRVTAVGAGHTLIRLTKGSTQSNTTAVTVRAAAGVPASITISMPDGI